MIESIPLWILFSAMVVLICLSACFSSSETALMALNRYRLRHLANHEHRGAQLAQRLLNQPDRLIGLILLGNNFVNIAATSLSTLIALRLAGEAGVLYSTIILTVVILIFAEVAPKTMAALKPERIAFPASYVLTPLLRVMAPLVWLTNRMASGVLKLFRIATHTTEDELSKEELRTVLSEGGIIPTRHKRMLLNILDLERATVEDVMVPRNELVGINLDNPLADIIELISSSPYTRLPVYRDSVDDTVGVLHVRTLLRLIKHRDIDLETIKSACRRPYFVPETTTLTQQLFEFQRRERRIALVIDEYGDIQGLVTLDDILEEIVGEFTTEPTPRVKPVETLPDGTHKVDAGHHVRFLNRTLRWSLPTEGSVTLNGLILEALERVPETGDALEIEGLAMTVLEVEDNAVASVRVRELELEHG